MCSMNRYNLVRDPDRILTIPTIEMYAQGLNFVMIRAVSHNINTVHCFGDLFNTISETSENIMSLLCS